MNQPGYDELADLYAATFDKPFSDRGEQYSIDLFVAEVGAPSLILDVGSGLGHVANYIATSERRVVGVEPSREMFRRAESYYPSIDFVCDDASLRKMQISAVDAIIARFSLIHVHHDQVPDIFTRWASVLSPGGRVLIAAQASDEIGGIEEFDHRVARAWRWHPDSWARALSEAGFVETWRSVTQPDALHRFPECHITARLGD